jgi:hypothetical protein
VQTVPTCVQKAELKQAVLVCEQKVRVEATCPHDASVGNEGNVGNRGAQHKQAQVSEH